MEARITYGTLCWGYRERAVAVAEALREKFGASVEVIGGSLGQFDVWVNGKLIVTRGANIAARIKPPRLPAVSAVLAAAERLHSIGTIDPDSTKQIRMRREFTTADAKRFYDSFGAKQDMQFYERAALKRLVGNADFEHAAAVFELGCGTGCLAESLLKNHLPEGASYTGIDISTTMIRIAAQRLSPWKSRATIQEADGSSKLPYADAAFDRFVVTYVLDLLPAEMIEAVLREAHRVLADKGKLCAVVSTEGVNVASRMLTPLWKRVYALSPRLVGGCRPLHLASLLDSSRWRIERRETMSSWGISSEVVVAIPI